MNAVCFCKILTRSQVNRQNCRRNKVEWLRIPPNNTHQKTSQRILSCQLLDPSNPNLIHLLPMLEVPNVLRAYRIPCDRATNGSTQEEDPFSLFFFLFLEANASPAVITLLAILIPCWTRLSLILSIGAEKKGELNKNAWTNVPVLAMVLPASIAIAAPREWPANHTLESPTAETMFWTDFIAI
ncbi:hypothetical protein LINGRAHAP2_LOCUS3024, partial [Linum grandiflorum]